MYCLLTRRGQVAQSVEQETENLRVGGSIPSLTIFFFFPIPSKFKSIKQADKLPVKVSALITELR